MIRINKYFAGCYRMWLKRSKWNCSRKNNFYFNYVNGWAIEIKLIKKKVWQKS